MAILFFIIGILLGWLFDNPCDNCIGLRDCAICPYKK